MRLVGAAYFISNLCEAVFLIGQKCSGITKLKLANILPHTGAIKTAKLTRKNAV